MKKINWRFIGRESLYMLVVALAMVGASAIQLLFMINTGEYWGGLFGGIVYKYNPVMYGLGMLLVVVAVILGYRFLLEKYMGMMKEIITKVLYFVIVLLFLFLAFIGEIAVYLSEFGLSGGIDSDVLEIISWYGWPLGVLIFMTFVFIQNTRK